MGEDTGIEWSTHSFNPWWGCVEVSPGCDRCYAKVMANRFGWQVWGKDAARRTFGRDHWLAPAQWEAKAKREGVRPRVFCASMGDRLEDRDELWVWRQALWGLIETTPGMDWLLLTKRPQNWRKMLPDEWLPPNPPMPNVWLMTTVESAAQVWRCQELVQTPAVVHAVSWEPGLAYADLKPALSASKAEKWVIGGGETGAGARPFRLGWVRAMIADAREIGAKFFLKQLGGATYMHGDMAAWPEDIRVREFPSPAASPAAGRADG